MEITLREQILCLHPSGAMYWPTNHILFLADVHIGKAVHFRNRGIAVPATVEANNLSRLDMVLQEYMPERVLFLGDLFHSHFNTAWESFAQWRSGYPNISFELIRGNHDILPAAHYQDAGVLLHSDSLNIFPFALQHLPFEERPEPYYGLSGHLHPGVLLRGNGRQALRLPCFYLGTDQGVLPAFGAFTGLSTIKPEKGSRVFVLTGEQVISV